MITLKVDTRKLEELQEFLRGLPRGVVGVAGEAVAKYIVGDNRHGLKHYVPYKYVSIKDSGGWASEKQRRYVMAKIREGEIDPGVPHRTGEMQRGWDYSGEGSRWRIENEVPYAGYVMGDVDQTQMHKIQGWRTAMRVAYDNLAGSIVAARSAVREWIRERRR